MSTNPLAAKTLNVVGLSEVLASLQRAECKKLGIDYVPAHQHFLLPDGSEAIRNRLIKIIHDSRYGNQQFTNDALYRFCLKHEEDDWEDEENEDIVKLGYLCKDYINFDGNFWYLIFETSW